MVVVPLLLPLVTMLVSGVVAVVVAVAAIVAVGFAILAVLWQCCLTAISATAAVTVAVALCGGKKRSNNNQSKSTNTQYTGCNIAGGNSATVTTVTLGQTDKRAESCDFDS